MLKKIQNKREDASFPAWLMTEEYQKLSLEIKSLYLLLVDHSDFSDPEGNLFSLSSMAELARITGVCRQTVGKWLKNLEESGIVIREALGSSKTAIYALEPEDCDPQKKKDQPRLEGSETDQRTIFSPEEYHMAAENASEICEKAEEISLPDNAPVEELNNPVKEVNTPVKKLTAPVTSNINISINHPVQSEKKENKGTVLSIYRDGKNINTMINQETDLFEEDLLITSVTASGVKRTAVRDCGSGKAADSSRTEEPGGRESRESFRVMGQRESVDREVERKTAAGSVFFFSDRKTDEDTTDLSCDKFMTHEELMAYEELIREVLCESEQEQERGSLWMHLGGMYKELRCADVLDRFRKINHEMISYVDWCVKRQTGEITNVRNYVLMSLYNARDTFFQARAQKGTGFFEKRIREAVQFPVA